MKNTAARSPRSCLKQWKEELASLQIGTDTSSMDFFENREPQTAAIQDEMLSTRNQQISGG